MHPHQVRPFRARLATGLGDGDYSQYTSEFTGDAVNPDHSINWEGAAKDGGKLAGAAMCAEGGPAAASLCGYVGGTVAGMLYDLGDAIFSSPPSPPPSCGLQPIPNEIDLLLQIALLEFIGSSQVESVYSEVPNDFTERLVKLRAMAAATLQYLVQSAAQQKTTVSKLYDAMGLASKLPKGWTSLLRPGQGALGRSTGLNSWLSSPSQAFGTWNPQLISQKAVFTSSQFWTDNPIDIEGALFFLGDFLAVSEGVSGSYQPCNYMAQPYWLGVYNDYTQWLNGGAFTNSVGLTRPGIYDFGTQGEHVVLWFPHEIAKLLGLASMGANVGFQTPADWTVDFHTTLLAWSNALGPAPIFQGLHVTGKGDAGASAGGGGTATLALGAVAVGGLLFYGWNAGWFGKR